MCSFSFLNPRGPFARAHRSLVHTRCRSYRRVSESRLASYARVLYGSKQKLVHIQILSEKKSSLAEDNGITLFFFSMSLR